MKIHTVGWPLQLRVRRVSPTLRSKSFSKHFRKITTENNILGKINGKKHTRDRNVYFVWKKFRRRLYRIILRLLRVSILVPPPPLPLHYAGTVNTVTILRYYDKKIRNSSNNNDTIYYKFYGVGIQNSIMMYTLK